MKIILSRKGFDSSYGGFPSPILSDETMLSMPIPSSRSQISYAELKYNGKSYLDILRKYTGKQNYDRCHLDPDIRSGIRPGTTPKGWKPAFGQIDTAQSHLSNNKVDMGDLFLFFGWFRGVDEGYRFTCDSDDWYKCHNIQAIYGYLQIGEIVNNEEKALNYSWHPHIDYGFNGNKLGLPGAGVFKFSNELVLTKKGMSRSKWEMPSLFTDNKIQISYHSERSYKDGYFQSAHRGQEFVIEESDAVSNWAIDLIRNNLDMR